MAKLWIVVVLLLAQNVFGHDEDDFQHICDSCIRLGRTWCHRRLNEVDDTHCIMVESDDACPDHDIEVLPHITNNTDGDLFKPMFAERTLYLKDYDKRKMTIAYASGKQRNVTISFLNTKNKVPKINVEIGDTQCESTACTVDIWAKPLTDFCRHFEYMDVAVNVEGFKEHATIRYHVPCSCECSKRPEYNSAKCDHHGNYTCGVCTCESEWTGERCDIKCGRGDQVQDACMVEKGDDLIECYGNGECACGICKCFSDRVGSQFFDPTEQCADACTKTIECEACLRNGTLGDCNDCVRPVTVIALNKTVATTTVDNKNRSVWVRCKEKVEEYYFDYYTTQTEEKFLVMIVTTGNDAVADKVGTGASSTQVPLILGILGLVAVVAAVGGILLWKHMNALPALPLTDPQYANIDAEDCTGENPLYKPPTSSFKNPTYGKW